MKKLIYQGVPGSYSSVASKYFGDASGINETQGFETFGEVRKNIDEHTFAVLPIENSYAGSIHENMYLSQEYAYPVHALYSLKIDHCLIGLEPEAKITEVYSHRQALAQTYHYCKKHRITQHVHTDTADSVRLIKELGKNTIGAIASSYAAELFEAPVLDKNIQDQENNETRFLLVGLGDIDISKVPKKGWTLLLFQGKERPGILVDCLKSFSSRGLNLNKIESLSSRSNPYEYMFWVQVEASSTHPKMLEAINELGEICTMLRIVGNV